MPDAGASVRVMHTRAGRKVGRPGGRGTSAGERLVSTFFFPASSGVDEAGRGPLAGPVVAAAAILPRDAGDLAPLLNDSKQMTAAARDAAYAALEAHPGVMFATAVVDAAEIDRVNILQATLQAMTEAVAGLRVPADAALVDGNRVPPALRVRHAAAVVKGDAKSAAIAAASIVAKVTRDRIMAAAHDAWPAYGFDAHKGYPTAAHVAAIARHGPCPVHRLTFAPLKGKY